MSMSCTACRGYRHRFTLLYSAEHLHETPYHGLGVSREELADMVAACESLQLHLECEFASTELSGLLSGSAVRFWCLGCHRLYKTVIRDFEAPDSTM